jgi:hypothetical protein
LKHASMCWHVYSFQQSALGGFGEIALRTEVVAHCSSKGDCLSSRVWIEPLVIRRPAWSDTRASCKHPAVMLTRQVADMSTVFNLAFLIERKMSFPTKLPEKRVLQYDGDGDGGTWPLCR